jgi:hypothetical protein
LSSAPSERDVRFDHADTSARCERLARLQKSVALKRLPHRKIKSRLRRLAIRIGQVTKA